MKIQLNGEPHTLGDGSTIAQLLGSLEMNPNQVAVERNAALVPRGQHAETLLAEGDTIEVVTLVGGG